MVASITIVERPDITGAEWRSGRNQVLTTYINKGNQFTPIQLVSVPNVVSECYGNASENIYHEN